MEHKNSKLGKLVTLLVTVPTEMLGILADLVEKLVSGSSIWFEALKRFLRKETVWGPQEFRVSEKFRVDVGKGATLKIVSISNQFHDWFRDDVEVGVPEELSSFVLTRPMLDSDIIDTISDVGGSVISSWSSIYNTLTTLSCVSSAIFYRPQRVEMSDGGECSYYDCKGDRVTEKVNSKYTFIRNGQWFVLRAVLVLWDVDGRRVNARSVENLGGWDVGYQVFSRNSVLRPLGT